MNSNETEEFNPVEESYLCTALKENDIEAFEKFAEKNHLVNTLKAINIAKRFHKGQERKTGEEYVLHPIRVAIKLKQFKIYDDKILAAAILHDVIEDCNVTEDDLIYKHFIDPIVAENVQILTQTEGISDEEYYNRIASSPIASLVKLFDRLDNLSTMLGAYKPEKMKLKIKETEFYIGKLIKICKEKYPEYRDVVSNVENQMQTILVMAKAYIHAFWTKKDKPKRELIEII